MASMTTTTRTDDFDGAPEADTYQFGYLDSDGVTQTVEIDLAGENASEFLHFLNRHIEAGRHVETTKRARKSAVSAPAKRTDREHTRAVRQWAADNGVAISDRGRLSTTVLAQYRAANA